MSYLLIVLSREGGVVKLAVRLGDHTRLMSGGGMGQNLAGYPIFLCLGIRGFEHMQHAIGIATLALMCMQKAASRRLCSHSGCLATTSPLAPNRFCNRRLPRPRRLPCRRSLRKTHVYLISPPCLEHYSDRYECQPRKLESLLQWTTELTISPAPTSGHSTTTARSLASAASPRPERYNEPWRNFASFANGLREAVRELTGSSPLRRTWTWLSAWTVP